MAKQMAKKQQSFDKTHSLKTKTVTKKVTSTSTAKKRKK